MRYKDLVKELISYRKDLGMPALHEADEDKLFNTADRIDIHRAAIVDRAAQLKRIGDDLLQNTWQSTRCVPVAAEIVRSASHLEVLEPIFWEIVEGHLGGKESLYAFRKQLGCR